MRVSFCLLALLLALPAHATIHHVPSEFGTIQTGIDACAPGDTVLVAPGTYTGDGNRGLSWQIAGLHLMSEAGAAETLIDCEEEGRAILIEGSDCDGAVIRGFTITHGYAASGYDTSGGAIYCNGVAADLADLTLVDNHAGEFFPGGRGGALAIHESSVTISNMTCLGNWTDGTSSFSVGTVWSVGGAVACYESVVEITNSVFRSNLAHLTDWGYDMCCPQAIGGAVSFYRSAAAIQDCLFVDNMAVVDSGSSSSHGSAVWSDSSISIENCTFVGNRSRIGSPLRGRDIEATACVFAHNDSYQTNHIPPEISCSVFWDNDLFDADYIGSDGNLETDPQFCGIPGSGNYYLQSDSPCLPENNDCGVLIGAFGQGCEDTPVLLSSFTAAPHDEGIELFWQLGGPSFEPDFRLSAKQDGTTRLLTWREESPGSFHALDADAGEGRIHYQLEGREADDAWQLLGNLDVDLPGTAPVAALLDPFPNPFNPRVTIPVRLSVEERIRLSVHDLAGRRLRVLTNGRLGAGRHDITWDGRDEVGSEQSSGVYLIRLESPSAMDTRRVTLLR